jgi:histidine ammonia-lyase
MPSEIHSISNKTITLDVLSAILSGNLKIELSAEAKEKIQKCRQYLDDKLKNTKETNLRYQYRVWITLQQKHFARST